MKRFATLILCLLCLIPVTTGTQGTIYPEVSRQIVTIPSSPNHSYHNHIDISQVPTHLQALTPVTFLVSLTGPPGWINGNITVVDMHNNPVIWSVSIPTNHSVYISIFPVTSDIRFSLRLDFPRSSWTHDFLIPVI